ncbi:hypothetical protein ACF8MD_42675 [Pseudomonas sp. zjy_8]
MKMHFLAWKTLYLLTVSLAISGCAGLTLGPTVNNNAAAYTPIYSDNRVYYLTPSSESNTQPAGNSESERTSPSNLSIRTLEPALTSSINDTNKIEANSPLSVVLRSVEIPAAYELDTNGKLKKSLVTEPADYVVLLDVGTKSDGTATTMAVWYQRGVQPGQSLNFSNLLVYYEPSWDQRVAPYFRVRVMDITKERNEETRKALERANGIIGGLGAIAKNPFVVPLIGISFTAADLVFANKENRLLLDYSVQLYSDSASGAAGNELGTLRKGSYVVVGRPTDTSRDFWMNNLLYEPKSRQVITSGKAINVPTMSLTVGAFESVVPTTVLERSAALTARLTVNNSDSTVDETKILAKRLSASTEALSVVEHFKRYGDYQTLDQYITELNENPELQTLLSRADLHSILSAVSKCTGANRIYSTLDEAITARVQQEQAPCVEKKQ